LRTAFTLRFLLKQCHYCKQTFDGSCKFLVFLFADLTFPSVCSGISFFGSTAHRSILRYCDALRVLHAVP